MTVRENCVCSCLHVSSEKNRFEACDEEIIMLSCICSRCVVCVIKICAALLEYEERCEKRRRGMMEIASPLERYFCVVCCFNACAE